MEELNRKDKLFLITGIIITILLFAYIEFLHPYNFTKDDNLAQFLPNMLHGLESLFSGEFPAINFHQYMGSPLFEVGTYAILYPVSILSYIIAHYALGNDFLFFEIFVFIHLLLGFIVTFYFIRSKIDSTEISSLASLAFIFSGYNIIASSNWYYVAPSILFFPLILLLVDHLIKMPSIKYAGLLGLIEGIYFYTGNAQYFVYSIIFSFLYLSLVCFNKKDMDLFKLAKYYIISIFLMVIISLPLLMGQLSIVHDSPRGNLNTINYFLSLPTYLNEYILGSLFSYPLISSSNSFAYSSPSFISIYYTGTLFSILFFIGIIYYLRKYKFKTFVQQPFLSLALFSILLSMGIFGIIYTFGAFLPVIKNFSYPFKITFYTNFFVILFGALFASILVKKINPKTFKKGLVVVSILFFTLILHHLYASSNVSWSYYGDDLPLNQTKFQSLELEGFRAISVFTNSSQNPRLIKFSNSSSSFSHAYTLSQSFATYFNIDHISGYEPFQDKFSSEKIPISRFGIEKVNLNLTSLKEYGVKWIFIPTDSLSSHSELRNLSIKYQEDNLVILEIPKAKSLIFSSEGPITYDRLHSKLIFDTNYTSANNVTINLLYKKQYKAFANSRQVPIYFDDYGRIRIELPEGNNNISIIYTPSAFYHGLAISVFVLIMIFLLYLLRNQVDYSLVETNLKSYLIKTKSKIKITKKNLIISIIIILLILFTLYYKTLASPNNVESIVLDRTGIDLDISKIQFNPFSGEVTLKNVSSLRDGNQRFSASVIKLDIAYFSSLKATILSKKLLIMFSEVYATDLVFLSSDKSPIIGDCQQELKLILPNNYAGISAEKLEASSTRFIPFNKIFISFNGNIKVNGVNGNITGDINVNQYVNGSIIVNKQGENSIQSITCIKLPLEKKSIIYTTI